MLPLRLPAFIKFHGDDELHFIGSQNAWKEDAQLIQTRFHPDDMLVDANGNQFSLQRELDDHVRCTPIAGSLSLEEVLQLVRRHAAQDGACCVAKLSAGSIAEAIALLA